MELMSTSHSRRQYSLPAMLRRIRLSPKSPSKLRRLMVAKLLRQLLPAFSKVCYMHPCLFELCSLHSSFMLGIERGNFHITSDVLGDIFRGSTAGSSPRNNYLLDLVYGLIGYVSTAVFRVNYFALICFIRLGSPFGGSLWTHWLLPTVLSIRCTFVARASLRTLPFRLLTQVPGFYGQVVDHVL